MVAHPLRPLQRRLAGEAVEPLRVVDEHFALERGVGHELGDQINEIAVIQLTDIPLDAVTLSVRTALPPGTEQAGVDVVIRVRGGAKRG